jgi:hypothetical protein
MFLTGMESAHNKCSSLNFSCCLISFEEEMAKWDGNESAIKTFYGEEGEDLGLIDEHYWDESGSEFAR